MLEFEYYNFSIHTVELRNFRKFDSLTVSFDEQITALTAPNGGGKSAIVHAMAVGCAHFVHSLGENSGIKNGFSPDDHRLVPQMGAGMTPASGDMEVICSGTLGHCAKQWSRERTYGVNNKTRISNAAPLQRFAKRLMEASAAADQNSSSPYPIAPLVAMYGTGRLAREGRLTEKRKPTHSDRFEGYSCCLNPESYFKVFNHWFKVHSAQLVQETPDSYRYRQISRQLQIVRDAVDTALECVEWRKLKWNFVRNELSMEHPQLGTLCFSQLSDGIQNVLNLIADISHRAVRLNPCADEHLLQNIRGLVMIDEIDMYLHPQWQQKIVSILKRIFPKVQFVITTHSPQVLSTLKKDQIRILGTDAEGRYIAESPGSSPYSRPSNEALANIFNVNPTPKVEESDDIVKVQQLYRTGQFEEAEELRRKLLVESGVEIQDADIRFWKLLSKRNA